MYLRRPAAHSSILYMEQQATPEDHRIAARALGVA
jgi:hypothetical protein